MYRTLFFIVAYYNTLRNFEPIERFELNSNIIRFRGANDIKSSISIIVVIVNFHACSDGK